MIRIGQLKLRTGHTEEDLRNSIARALRIRADDIGEYNIIRQSVDARNKPEIWYIYTIDVKTENEKRLVGKARGNQIAISADKAYYFPEHGKKILKNRPLVAGSGPAGLFCGLMLAEQGYRPVILERGEDVDSRTLAVDRFWKTGILDTVSNVQFGEGGAGTFSDGKLNTLVKDPSGRNKKVLELFVEAGAPSDILYVNKPHIGTDILVEAVKNIRSRIQHLGGEIRFCSQVTDLDTDNGKLCSVTINREEKIKTDILVLAIGHSARDTLEMLSAKKLNMSAKSFAVGFRIEHSQRMINFAQYGTEEPGGLPAASYKLAKTVSTGRGVYTFCMCPGGYVVNASSEAGLLAVNGMSYHKRDGINANSAVIVTVTPEDFGANHVLSGVEFQRRLEEKAGRLAGGKIPVQLFGDFCSHRITKELGDIVPCTKGAFALSDLSGLLPAGIGESLAEGIRSFDQRIKGFARHDAVLSGIESRTSSPVRINRDDEMESSIKGVYPCGEGAGYAGGIMSAAMDGIKAAEAIAKVYASCK